jgi:hypothetical protein
MALRDEGMRQLLVVCIGLLTCSCGSSDPDCGSDATINLVRQMAKDHGVLLQAVQGSLFMEFAREHGRKIHEARAASISTNPPKYVYSSPPPMWCRDKSHNPTWADYHAPCFNHNPTTAEIIESDPGAGIGMLDAMGEVQAEIDREVPRSYIKDNIRYSLDTIRTIAKDHDTSAVSCVARLHTVLSLNERLSQTIHTSTWSTEIPYSVETTTDRKLYVTLNDGNAR